MKQPGYTIIELVVALSIAAILLALTLPRYDSFEQHSVLRGQVEQLANCLQSAYQSVISPLKDQQATYYNTVTLTQTRSSLICQVTPEDQTKMPILSTPSVTTFSLYECVNNTSSGYAALLETQAAQSPNPAILTAVYNPFSYTLSTDTHGVIDSVFDPFQKPDSSSYIYGSGKKLTLSLSSTLDCKDTITLIVPAAGAPVMVGS